MPSLFFNKVAGLWPATLIKKRLWHRCFPVNFAKFLRTPLQNTSGRLLLLTFFEYTSRGTIMEIKTLPCFLGNPSVCDLVIYTLYINIYITYFTMINFVETLILLYLCLRRIKYIHT